MLSGDINLVCRLNDVEVWMSS